MMGMQSADPSAEHVSDMIRAIKADLEYIRATGLTKDDLDSGIAALTRRMYVFFTLLATVVFFIARYV
jgi:hypothetical protein